MIVFHKVKDEYGWLSNMSPHPVQMGRVTARSAEAMFQALRFGLAEPAIVTAILEAKSPMAAKMVAKKYADKMLVQPRSEMDVACMMSVLVGKLQTNPVLQKKLIDTGDEEIVEYVNNRPSESGLFWGAVVENGNISRGENTLGKLWMQIRATIKPTKGT